MNVAPASVLSRRWCERLLAPLLSGMLLFAPTAAADTNVVRAALTLADRGDYGEALALLLPHLRDTSASSVAPDANLAAARIHQLRGDATRAMAALRRSGLQGRRASAATGLVPDVVRGLIELTSQRADAAATLFRDIIADAAVAADSEGGLAARVGLGRALLAEARFAEAAQVLTEAAHLARNGGHQLALADALHADGERLRLTGATTQADAALREALALARDLDVPRVTAPAAFTLYESATARGDHAASVEYLRLHTDARLRLTGDTAMRRLVDVLVEDAAAEEARAPITSPLDAARRAEAADGVGSADVVRTSLLGASLSALLLAAVLWRVGYTRGRRLLHYRQELEALRGALTTVSALDGLLTICASCKDVRDDSDEWTRVDAYLAARTDARFTHSVCPRCEQRVLDAADLDLDGMSSGSVRAERLRGGFDWPPTDEELARVIGAASSEPDSRSGRWS